MPSCQPRHTPECNIPLCSLRQLFCFARARPFLLIACLTLILQTFLHDLHPGSSQRNLNLHPTLVQTSNSLNPPITNSTILKILSSPFSSHIIVSETSNLIFCPIPKAANTNWKYLIRKWDRIPTYDDLPSSHHPLTSGLRYLSDYSPSEALHLLTTPTFFRFVFVRDPYTRLLSCFMDKFRNTDPAYTSSEYRTFLSQLFSWRYTRSLDLHTHPRPSFRMFVDELLKHSPTQMNPHWMPQTHYCGLGLIPYDFIGRMENLELDANYVFSRLGKHNEHFPSHSEIGFPPSGASRHLADDLYTVDLMFKVRVVYDDDFRLLGYI